MKIQYVFKKNSSLKGVLFSSIAMAFAGLGDALLYSVLPIYGEQMGFSVFWIGVFLSINRFVRIPGNALVAYLISQKGYKEAMLIATFFAMITTLFYGLEIGVVLFSMSRIVWGLSYSTMRVSSLAYASESLQNKNIMFGLVQSIKTTGAVLALFVGSYLIKYYSVKVSFLTLGSLSFLAVLFAYKLPDIKKKSTKINIKKILNFSTINVLTFFTSFIIDGVLVVTISQLLGYYSTEELIIVVSGYLLFRKLCSAIISVFSGWLSDRLGVVPVFKMALVFVLSSLLFILGDYIETGVVIAFLFNSIIVAMLPSIALKLNTNNKLTTLTAITTWWDIGAATGTLVGLYLVQLLGSPWLFGLLFCLLLGAVVVFFRKYASFSLPKHLQEKNKAV